MEIKIRNYESMDFDDLLLLLNKVYGSKIDRHTLETQYLTNNRGIIVAVTNDMVLVGCAFTEIQVDYIRPERVLYVTYVAVNEKYRKLGIGRKLFDTLEQLCHSEKCTAIELTSADFRTEAHAFYDKIGFTKKKTTLFIKEVIKK